MHTTYARLPKVRERTREKRKHDEIPCMTNLDVPTIHFSMSLNFQRILQFHPTVMSVAYVDYSFIRYNMPLQICRLLIVFSSRYILEIFADFGFQHSYYLGANRFNMRPYSYDLRLPFTTHAWSLLFGGNKSADGKISTRSYENFYWFYYKRNRKDVLVKYNKRIINVCYRHDCWVELKDALKVQTNAEVHRRYI
jgi:hypothetical protein